MGIRVQTPGDLEAVSAPNRVIREIFSGRTENADGVTLRLVELAPRSEQGARTPHWHDGFEEVIYVLSGSGTMWDEGAWRPIRAGDTVLVPAGTRHATFNNTEAPLRILCFFPVPDGVDARIRVDFSVSLPG